MPDSETESSREAKVGRLVSWPDVGRGPTRVQKSEDRDYMMAAVFALSQVMPYYTCVSTLQVIVECQS